MFDFISDIELAWATIEHISEWTGMSVGVLALLGLLAYLDSDIRKWAIRAGILVIFGYAVLLYGYTTGQADKQYEWDMQKARDAAAQAQRDLAIRKKLLADNPAPTATNRQVSVDEQNALKALAGVVSCPLGTDALRLRHK